MKKLKLLIVFAVTMTLSLLVLAACPNGGDDLDYFTVIWTAPSGLSVTAEIDGQAISTPAEVEEGARIQFNWNVPNDYVGMRILIDLNPVHIQNQTGAGGWLSVAVSAKTTFNFELMTVLQQECLECDFTQEARSIATSRTVATCLLPATYWYSCEECGEISATKYFIHGYPLGHDFGMFECGDECVRVGCEVVLRCGDCPICDLFSQYHQVLIGDSTENELGISNFIITTTNGVQIFDGDYVAHGTELRISFNVAQEFVAIMALYYYWPTDVWPLAFLPGHNEHIHIVQNEMYIFMETFDGWLGLHLFFMFHDWTSVVVQTILGLDGLVYLMDVRHQTNSDYFLIMYEVSSNEVALTLKPTFMVNLGSVGFDGGYIGVYHNYIFVASRNLADKIIGFKVRNENNLYITEIKEYTKNFSHISDWADFIRATEPHLNLFYMHAGFMPFFLPWVDYFEVALVAEDPLSTSFEPGQIWVVKLECSDIAFELGMLIAIEFAMFMEDMVVGIADNRIIFFGFPHIVDALAHEFGGERLLNLDNLRYLGPVYQFIRSVHPDMRIEEVFFRSPQVNGWEDFEDDMEEMIRGFLIPHGSFHAAQFNCSARALIYATRRREGTNVYHVTVALSPCGYTVVWGDSYLTNRIVEEFDWNVLNVDILTDSWMPIGVVPPFFNGTTLHITQNGNVVWRVFDQIVRVGTLNPYQVRAQNIQWISRPQGETFTVVVQYRSWFATGRLLLEANVGGTWIHAQLDRFNWAPAPEEAWLVDPSLTTGDDCCCRSTLNYSWIIVGDGYFRMSIGMIHFINPTNIPWGANYFHRTFNNVSDIDESFTEYIPSEFGAGDNVTIDVVYNNGRFVVTINIVRPWSEITMVFTFVHAGLVPDICDVCGEYPCECPCDVCGEFPCECPCEVCGSDPCECCEVTGQYPCQCIPPCDVCGNTPCECCDICGEFPCECPCDVCGSNPCECCRVTGQYPCECVFPVGAWIIYSFDCPFGAMQNAYSWMIIEGNSIRLAIALIHFFGTSAGIPWDSDYLALSFNGDLAGLNIPFTLTNVWGDESQGTIVYEDGKIVVTVNFESSEGGGWTTTFVFVAV